MTESDAILIVDDVPANLAIVVEALEEHGFDILVAQDGEEGNRLQPGRRQRGQHTVAARRRRDIRESRRPRPLPPFQQTMAGISPAR